MDVNRLVQTYLLFKMTRQKNSLPLRVRCRPLTARIPRARDKTPRNRGGLIVKPHLDQVLFYGLHVGIRDIRYQKILPNRQAQLTCPIILRNVGQPAHLLRLHASYGDDGADIVQSLLRLFEHSDMAVRDWNISLYTLSDGEADERKCEFLFDFLEEFRDAPLVDQVFESGSLPVGSVPVFDKHTNDCSRKRHAFGRFDK